MSECWTFNVALLNLNLRRVHLRAVHAARARALPPGAQVEARKSQDCMMPEALLGPIVRTPAFPPNTLACAHETHELRHRSTLRDRQGAGTLCASASRPRWRALRPPRLHGPYAVMDRCEERRDSGLVGPQHAPSVPCCATCRSALGSSSTEITSPPR